MVDPSRRPSHRSDVGCQQRLRDVARGRSPPTAFVRAKLRTRGPAVTDSQLDHPTVGTTVAERLERRPGAGPIKPVALRIVHEFDALDRAVYAAIAQTPTATLDAALRRVSDAADHSKLWIGTAAG